MSAKTIENMPKAGSKAEWITNFFINKVDGDRRWLYQHAAGVPQATKNYSISELEKSGVFGVYKIKRVMIKKFKQNWPEYPDFTFPVFFTRLIKGPEDIRAPWQKIDFNQSIDEKLIQFKDEYQGEIRFKESPRQTILIKNEMMNITPDDKNHEN